MASSKNDTPTPAEKIEFGYTKYGKIFGIIILVVILTSILLPRIFPNISSPRWMKHIQGGQKTLSGETIYDVSRLQKQGDIEIEDNGYKSSDLEINGTIEYLSSREDSKAVFLAKEENITLTHLEGDTPDFRILEGKKYKNEGEKIIFPLAPLTIKFNIPSYINGKYYHTNDILAIDRVNLLPRFYEVQYIFNENGKKIQYSDTIPHRSVPKNKSYNWKAVEKGVVNYTARLNTHGSFSFQDYGRKNKNIEDIHLLGYMNKKLMDFNTQYPDLHDRKSESMLSGFSYKENMEYFDFSDKISTKRGKGSFDIFYKDLPKNMHFVLFFKESGNSQTEDNYYTTYFQTIGDFALTYSKDQYSTKRKINNYHICTNHPLDETKTRKSFTTEFGTGKVTLAFSEQTEAFTHQNKKNSCILFYYYTDPDKKLHFKPSLYSIYNGESTVADIVVGPYAISDSKKQVQLVGERFNILPLHGEWGNKIQLGHINMKSFPITTKSCSWNFKEILPRIKKAVKANADPYRRRMTFHPIDFVIDCKHTKKNTFVPKHAEYWTNYISDFVFSDYGISSKLVAVYMKKDGSDEKIYQRTNLGIIAKYGNRYTNYGQDTPETTKKMYVRVQQLDTGKIAKNTKVSIYGIRKNGETFELHQQAKDGDAVFDIPKNTSFTYITARKGNDIAVSFARFNQNIQIGNTNVHLRHQDQVDGYSVGLENAGHRSMYTTMVYAYTDRVLYKPGDDVFVSGWVKNVNKNTVSSGTVVLQLKGNRGEKIAELEDLYLDAFGGFTGTLHIPEDSELGSFYLIAQRADQEKNLNNSHGIYIKVEEYKKHSFFIDTSTVTTPKNESFLNVRPKYYFGTTLKKWDVQVEETFRGDEYGIYDWFRCNKNDTSRRWCDKPLYFNAQIGGEERYEHYEYQLDGYTRSHIDIPINTISPVVFGSTNYDIRVIDQASEEIVTKNIVKSVSPAYAIGLAGWKRDYIYSADKMLSLSGRLYKKNQNETTEKDIVLHEDHFQPVKKDKVNIAIYQKRFEQDEEEGPDGEWYYVDGDDYKIIFTGSVDVKNGIFAYDFVPEQGGDFFVKFSYTEGEHTYSVEKLISVYATTQSGDQGFWGNLNNNIKLNINVTQKNYIPGDTLTVNINPYIKGSTAIITVEQGDTIIHTEKKIVDGSAIQLQVEKDWFPNAYISVAMIVGENINTPLSQHRKEPRLFVGYANVELNPELVILHPNITITDSEGKAKKTYEPGEKIQVRIQVKDYTGVGKKTRLSVGIVDKALLDIYDRLRSPIAYFYNKFMNAISTVTNYKNLYKALKVFSADGSKGGGGGDGIGELFPMRKTFHDVAYWNGALITDDNGFAQFETVLPDNLTTRVVDVIGIDTTNSMGTQRKSFAVSKKVILEPNLPKFVTLNDEITIPYKLLVDTKKIDKRNIHIKGTMQFPVQTGHVYPLVVDQDKETVSLNLKDLSDVQYKNLIASEYITLTLQAIDKKTEQVYDAVKHDIIVRKDGFVLSQFAFDNTKHQKHIFPLGDTEYAKIRVHVSNVPIAAFEKALNYLIHYPYGCTEQIISGLYPVISAQTLYEKNLLSSNIIRENPETHTLEVSINNKFQSIDSLVHSTLSSLYDHQKHDGGMGYREYSEEPSDPYLSAYVYGVFLALEDQGYSIRKDVLSQLKHYLTQSHNLTDIEENRLLLYLSLQESLHKKDINTHLVKEKMQENAKDTISKILGYVALKKNNPKYTNPTLKAEIKNLFLNHDEFENTTKNYNYVQKAYFSRNIMLAYFMRTLDPEESKKYIPRLLRERNDRGIWSYSTQENVQILLSLGEYLEKTNIKTPTPYMVKIRDKKDGTWGEKNIYTGMIDIQNKDDTIVLSYSTISDIEIEVSADNNLLFDTMVEYLPKNISTLADNSSNIELFNLAVEGKKNKNKDDTRVSEYIRNMNIGEEVTFVGNFETTKDANKVAISYYIPSTISLHNPALKNGDTYRYFDNEDDGIRFENTRSERNDRYSCYPQHMEVRFDRLFLYYDTLDQGKGCRVVFKGTKTHNGESHVMPAELFEMYTTQVSATYNVK